MVGFVVKDSAKNQVNVLQNTAFYNLCGQIYGQYIVVILNLCGFAPCFADYAHLRKIYVFCYLYQKIRMILNCKRKEGMPEKETKAGLPSGDVMPFNNGKRICKALHQYSKGKISSENMDVLMEIGHGCMVTKNYIYQRYGSIKSLGKLYPGHAIETEVKAAGFRERIGLPSVYFTASVNRALGDIKIMWAQVKSGINDAASKNEHFSPEDRHYIRFVVKVSGCLEGILNGKPVSLPEEIQSKYESVIAKLGDETGQRVRSLNRYICRQTRKRLRRLHTDNATYFTMKKQGYRYGESEGEHGIFLATKVNRQRMFIPLTDTNVYDRMLDIKLNPQKRTVEIIIPLFVNTKQHEEYTNEIGISLGLWDMITTSTGNVYGSEFGKKQQEISQYILKENYQNGRENISETQKYAAHKAKMDAALKNYVNMEINRMLAQEKPGVVYMVKLPRNPGMLMKGSGDTHFLRMWRKGFVTERIQWKCQENGIEIIEVIGKGVSTECSVCGQKGYMKGENFRCSACGFEENKKVNGARNAMNRGKTGRQLNKQFPQEKDMETSRGTATKETAEK